MIRGLVGVVPEDGVEVGRFYLAFNHDRGPVLFQCIETNEPAEGELRRKILNIMVAGKADLELCASPCQGPFVALDDVHIRVDPTSIAGSAFTCSLRAGVFMLDGDQPIICAPMGWRGFEMVNLSTGRAVVERLGHGWLSFTRWSLVMDNEAGEELTIVNFSDEATAT